MVLSKSLLLFFLIFIKYSCGGKDYTDSILKEFGNGQYEFYPGERLPLANTTSSSQLDHYTATHLAYYGNCLGFSTETLVTIILDCPKINEERIGCFQVLTPHFDTQNNTIFFTEKETRICVSKLDKCCVGLKIKEKVAIILKCNTYDCIMEMPTPKSIAGQIPLNIRPSM